MRKEFNILFSLHITKIHFTRCNKTVSFYFPTEIIDMQDESASKLVVNLKDKVFLPKTIIIKVKDINNKLRTDS